MAIQRRFLADGANRTLKLSAGSGLNQSFSRGVVTVDPDGTHVDADQPRRDGLVHVAAVPPPINGGPFEPFYESSGYLLASGFDADGTELLLHLRSDNGFMVVFRDGSPSPIRNYELTLRDVALNSFNSDPNHPTQFRDLLSTAAAPENALEAKTAVIVHGALIVGGPLWVRQSDGKYELLGWGFAINQNSGAQPDWRLFWGDPGEAQPYVPRGLYWCMSAAPIYQRIANPMACSICCTNYMFKDQLPPGGQAASGRAYYFRILRSVAGGTWTVGQGSYVDRVMSFDIRPGVTFQGVPFRKINHAHSCMATEWTADGSSEQLGVQLVVSIGDDQVRSRFVRFTMADYTKDYSVAGNWSAQENYHGKADLESGPSEATLSMQPATTFFGPNPGEITWLTDLTVEWVSLMRLPNGGQPPDQAQIEHLYGWATGHGHDPSHPGDWRSRPVIMGLSQPCPELATSPIAAVYDEPTLEGREPEARRVLLCPDPTKPREWVQLGATHNLGGSPTVKIHKGHVYMAQLVAAGKIQRVPIPSLTPVSAPTLVAVRPLLVSCGGKNLVKAGTATGTGGSFVEQKDATEVVRLTRSAPPGTGAPTWFDGALNLGKAPTLATLGLKLRSMKYPTPNASNYAARVRLSTDIDDLNSWSTLPPGYAWATGVAQVRRVRLWVRDGSYNKPGIITPNKTNHIQVRAWDEDPLINAGGNASWYSASDRWAPCTFIGVRTITALRALGLRLGSHGNGAAVPSELDDNYGYMAVGEAFDGNGVLPYPIAPETEGPDELLHVGGFSLGTNHYWSLKVALMLPMGNWDQWAGRETFNGSGVSGRWWPLLTLRADTDRYVEFLADCENRGFLVRFRTGPGSPVGSSAFGNQKQVWLPESPLLLAFGFDPTTNRVTVGASLGGGMVQVATDEITGPGAAITHLRFRGATGGTGAGADGEVCEMRIIGGEINPTGTLTASAMPNAFADLGFLYVT